MAIASINPANGETLKTFEPLTSDAIETKLDLAWTAFTHARRRLSQTGREKLKSAAEHSRNRERAFGRIMTSEMGKTLKSADCGSAEMCAWLPLLRRAR